MCHRVLRILVEVMDPEERGDTETKQILRTAEKVDNETQICFVKFLLLGLYMISSICHQDVAQFHLSYHVKILRMQVFLNCHVFHRII